jgi:hypothetical protein
MEQIYFNDGEEFKNIFECSKKNNICDKEIKFQNENKKIDIEKELKYIMALQRFQKYFSKMNLEVKKVLIDKLKDYFNLTKYNDIKEILLVIDENFDWTTLTKYLDIQYIDKLMNLILDMMTF